MINEIQPKIKFQNIVQCPFNYGILIWGSTCKTYIDKILKLQKWVLRTISDSYYRVHTDPLFVKNNVLNVYDMYKLETGVFMYKLLFKRLISWWFQQLLYYKV